MENVLRRGKRGGVRLLALGAAFVVGISSGIAGSGNIAAAAPGDFVSRPDAAFRDSNTPTGERLEGILSQLTLQEKISLSTTSPAAGAINRLGLGASRGGSSEAVHGVSGTGSTVFPVPLGFSQSWDRSLLKNIGNAIATEGAANNSFSWWAPVLDLARDPRAGRNYELLGEDSYLVGQLGVEMSGGMNARTSEDGYFQGTPLLKHAIGYNVEVNRLWLNSSLPERAKNEYYIKSFQQPIAAGTAKAFMNSYPLINGKPMSVNPIQRDALTKWTPDYTGTGHNEYGTVNDYGSGSSMWVHSQRYFEDTPAGRALGLGESIINGQRSWSFRDYGSTAALIWDALARGIITETDIENNARRALATGLRYGTYDQTEIKSPYLTTPYAAKATLATEHRIDALRASQEQVVLLKNEGNTLPLNGATTTKAVLVGGMGEEIGHNNYTPRSVYSISIKNAFTNKLGAAGVFYDRAVDTVAFKASNGKYLEASPAVVYSNPGASANGQVSVKATGDKAGANWDKTADKNLLYQWYDYGTINHLLRSKANDRFLQVPHFSSGGALAGQLVNNTFAPGQGQQTSGFSYVAYQHFRIMNTDDGKVGLYNLIAGDGGNNPYGETAMAYDQDDEDANNGSYLYVDNSASDTVRADASDGKVGPPRNETHTAGPSLLNEAPWDIPITPGDPVTDNKTVDNLPADHKFELEVVESSTAAIQAQVAAAGPDAPIFLVIGYDEWLNAREAIDLQETGLPPQQIRNIEYITGMDADGDPSNNPTSPLNRDVNLIIKTSSPMAIDKYVHNNPRVKSIVEIGNSGQEEGSALVSTLFNDGYTFKDAANFLPKETTIYNQSYTTYPGYLDATGKIPFKAPAGRLSSTWYDKVSDMIGASEDHPPASFRWPAYDENTNDQFSNLNGTVPEGLNQYDIVKGERTYQYLDMVNKKPLYEFGYGLTYSPFTYENVNVSAISNGKFKVSGAVKNTGTYTSDEVVQVYSAFAGTPSRIKQPTSKLIAFDRLLDIAPNTSRSFEFTVDLVAQLGVWDVEIGDYIVEPGNYDIKFGHSSLDSAFVTKPLTLTAGGAVKAAATRNLSKDITLAESFDDYSNKSGDLEDVELVSANKELYSNTAVSLRANGAWLAYKNVQLTGNGTLSVKVGSDRPGNLELHVVAKGAPAPNYGATASRKATIALTDTRPLDPAWDASSNHTGTGLGIGPIVVRSETGFDNDGGGTVGTNGANRQYPNSPKGKIATETKYDGANAYIAPVMQVQIAAITGVTAGNYDVYLVTQNRGTKVEWLKTVADATDSLTIKSPSGEYAIQSPQGQLPLAADLVPQTSTSSVAWSVSLPHGVAGNVADIATIDAQGILKATGGKNGTVVVTAVSNGKAATLNVPVTNQLTSNRVTINARQYYVTFPIVVTNTAVGGADVISAYKGTLQQNVRFSPRFEDEAKGYYLPGTQRTVPLTSVAWSITDLSGNPTYLATISAAGGLVTATGNGNGKVLVTATLTDNTDIKATRVLTIVNQGQIRDAYSWIQAESFTGTSSTTVTPASTMATPTVQGNELGMALALSANSLTSYMNVDFDAHPQSKVGFRLAPTSASVNQPYQIEVWADAPSADDGGKKLATLSGTLGASTTMYDTVVADVETSLVGVHDVFVKTNRVVNVNWFQFATKDVVKERLAQTIAVAQTQIQGAASDAVWAAFQAKLAAAQVVAANASATQQEVDAATSALEGGIVDLVESQGPDLPPATQLGGLSALLLAIDAMDADKYTTESWTVLHNVVNIARAYLQPNATPTQEQVSNVTQQLGTALGALKEKPVVAPTVTATATTTVTAPAPTVTATATTTVTAPGTTTTVTAPGTTTTVTAPGTTTTVTAPGTTTTVTAPAPAVTVTAPGATVTVQPAPAAAAASTLTAISTQLRASLSTQGQYTAASWAAYVQAQAAAQLVLTNPNATVDQVNAALNQLLGSVVGLQLQQAPNSGGSDGPTTPVAKVTTKSVTVKGVAFKKNTAPKVTVTVKLSKGTAKGKVAVYVGSKLVKTVNVSKATTSITLPAKYKKAIKVRAQYKPAKANVNGTQKLSAFVNIKTK